MPSDEEILGGFEPANLAAPRAVGNVLADPERAGKALTLSRETGTPASVIDADITNFENLNRQRRARTAVEQNGHIADYVNRVPMGSKVSNDDYDSLDQISKAAKPVTEESIFHRIWEGAKKGFKEEPIGFSDENKKYMQENFPLTYNTWAAGAAIVADTAFRLPFALTGAVGGGVGAAYEKITGEQGWGNRLENEVANFLNFAMIQAPKGAPKPKDVSKEIKNYIDAKEPPPVGLHPEVDAAKDFQSRVDAIALDKMIDTVNSGKTKMRSPEAMEEYLKGVVGDRTVSVPVADVLKLYKDRLPEPGDGLFGYVKDVAKQLEIAAETGGEIQVPMAAYLAHMDPTVHKALTSELRARDGGLTPTEAKELKAQKIEEGTPPIEEGFVRFYHGGADPGSGGGRWVTTDPNYARDFRAGEGKRNEVHFVDIPKGNPVEIAARKWDMLDEAAPEFSNRIGKYNHIEIPEEFAKQLKPLKNQVKETASPTEAVILRERQSLEPTVTVEDKEFTDTRGKGIQYHGSSIVEMKPEEGFYSTLNIYGQGLYTTDAVDIAYGYSRKGSKNTGSRGLYEVKEKEPVKLFDMEAPLDPELVKRLSNIDGTIATAAEQGPKNLRELMDEVRDIGTGEMLSADSIQEIFAIVQEELSRSGYEGMKHKGGLKTGKKEHGVTIYFEPEKQLVVTKGDFEKFVPGAIAQSKLSPIESTIRRERQALRLDPLFDEAKAAGLMTETEFARYSKKIEAQEQSIFDRANSIAIREERRKQTSEWKKAEAEVRSEIETDLRARPDLIADRFFRLGDLPTGERVSKVSLDKGVVESVLGKGKLSEFVRENGMHPDEWAEYFDYRSGKELLQALEELENARKITGDSPKKYFDRQVEDLTQARMYEKFGELERNILEDAREVALSRAAESVLLEEAQVLAGKLGDTGPLKLDQIKSFVLDTFDKVNAKTARNYEYFRRAVFKGGREAEQALLAGKFDEAFRAKQRQLMAFEMAREARTFAKEIEKAETQFDRLGNKTIASIDQGAMDQIHRVLDQIGYGNKRNPEELAGALQGKSLENYARARAGEGWELAIPEWLLEGREIKWDEMTSAEVREARDAIESLAHMGRAMKQFDLEGKKLDWLEFKTEALARITSLDAVNPDKLRLRSKIDAEIVKMEALITDLDLMDPLGPLNTSVFRPLVNAKHAENALLKDLQGQLHKIDQGKDWQKTLRDQVPNDFLIDPHGGGLFNLTRSDMLQIALNFGNRSNINKFVRGYEEAYKRSGTNYPLEMKIKDWFAENMAEKDWKFVQGIWDIFEGLKEKSDVMYRELAGVAPDKIVPESFTTKFGTQKGGYFPIIYDKFRSNIEFIREHPELFEENYTRATTPRGYTRSRSEGFAEPIQIQSSIEQTAFKMQQIAHDIAFRRAVLDAGRVIYDKDIRAAIRTHYGPEYEKQLSPWLEKVANGNNTNDAALSATNWVLRKARTNLVIQALGFNYKVIASPAMGQYFTRSDMIANSISMFRSYDHAQSEWNFAQAKSKELPNMLQNMDRDFREKFDSLTAKHGWDRFQQNAAKVSMWGAAKTNQYFGTLQWLSEYRGALKEGLPEADAVFLADKAVRKWIGSSHAMDLPALFNSSEGMKTLTLFQGYLNTLHNQVRDIPGHLRRGEFSEAGATAISSFLIPSLFTMALFNERGKDETLPTTVAKGVGVQAASTIPFLNILASAWVQGYDAKLPLASIVKGAYDVMADAYKYTVAKEVNRGIQHVINLPGYLLGLPTGQIAKSSQYLADVKKGKANPENFYQYLKGIAFGPERKPR